MDDNTVVYNTLPSVKVCRYVRLLPITIWTSLRMELYGEGPVPSKLLNHRYKGTMAVADPGGGGPGPPP